MSTNGSFSPTPVPECAYTPRMTRAQALALRTASGLNPNCVVVVTDGPVIGTAGNTSPTEIELNPVSATDLGLTARVHTTFAASAWDGLYDIDAGAAGTITQLEDDWNNRAVDEDPNAPTVHTQVPWHRGSATFSGNSFDTAVLPGWATAVGELTDNDIQGSTVNLTGMTAFVTGVFRRNQIRQGSSVTIVSNQTTVLQNNIFSATVNCQSGAQFGLIDNDIRSGFITVDNTTTGRVAVSECTINDSYRISVIGYTGPNPGCIISGNTLATQSTGLFDLRCGGSATLNFTGNTVKAGAIDLNGSGVTEVNNNTFAGSNITKAAASVAPLHFTRNQFTNAVLSMSATNAAVDNLVDQSTFRGGVLDLRGPVAGGGRNDFIRATVLDLQVIVAATATAGLRFDGGVYNKGAVNQNRTAGTLSTALNDCTTLGITCVITDNGTVDPGQPVNLNRVMLNDSPLTINSLTASRTTPDVVSEVDMVASLLFVSGLGTGGDVKRGRMLNGNLTTSFAIDTFTLDGLTKTAGAAQTFRAGSVAFDNWT